MLKKLSLFLTLILLLAACAPQPTPENTAVPPATEMPSEAPALPPPTEIPTETAAPSEDGCPAATADLKLMVDTESGFCLLYPAEFTWIWDGSSFVILNPYPGPSDIPGDAWLNVEVSDAGGKTAAQIVDAELAALGEGFNITRTELTIDGKQAILVDGLPAFDSARFIYIVNNDRLYRFDFLPWFPKDGTTPLEKIYQSVVDTLHFLPTSRAASAGVNECPTETETLKLLVNNEDGYCLLYPAGLGLLPPRLIVINPNEMPGDVLGDAWLDVLVNNANGQTAAQIADAKIAEWGAGFNITRTELTIDGKQAILVDGLPAQDSMRVVFIVHKDMLYSFEFMPWYPENGATPLESLYTAVMGSLHFLP